MQEVTAAPHHPGRGAGAVAAALWGSQQEILQGCMYPRCVWQL